MQRNAPPAEYSAGGAPLFFVQLEDRHVVEAESALLGTPVLGHSSPAPLLHLRAKSRRMRRLRSETLACGRVSSPNGTRCAGLPFGAAFGVLLLVQFENRHKRLGGQLHGSKGPHFLFAPPKRDAPVWVPGFFKCSGEVNSPSAKVLPPAKRLYGAKRRPAVRGPRKAKRKCSAYSSSSLRTAINASVGNCTVPRVRIFFLPSFCFSSSFFFRVMSPP